MAATRAVLGLALLWLAGFGGATLLCPAAPRALRAGWGFALGSGALSLGLGAAALLGLPPWTGAALPLAPLAVWVARRRHPPRAPQAAVAGGDLVALALLAALLVPTVALAVTTPLPGWDGVAIWGFKGRIFFLEGRLPLAYFHDPVTAYSHPAYPLHVPLVLAGLAHAVGGWEEPLLRLPFPAWLASLLLCLWGALRPWLSPGLCAAVLAGVAALPAVAGHAAVAYADLPLAAVLAGALAGVARWLEHGDRGALALGALAGGLGAWTKTEGLAWVAILGVAAWILAPRAGHPRAALLPALGLALAVALPWHVFRLLHDIPALPYRVEGAWQLARVPAILGALGGEMAALARWGALWPVALAAGLASPWLARRAGRPAAALGPLALAGGLAAYVAAYAASPFDLAWQLPTSADRLLLHCLPAAVLAVGAGAAALAGRPAGDAAG